MNNKVNRIRILPTDVPHKRLYAVSRRIALTSCPNSIDQPFEKGGGRLGTYKNFAKDWGCIPALEKAINDLIQLEGVEQLYVECHGITIMLGRVYDFEDCQAEILTILRECFFEGDSSRSIDVQDCATPSTKP